MRKIAIVTIESINYGNRLQNFALQSVLEKLNFDVQTLRRKKKSKDFKYFVKRFMQEVLQTKSSKFRHFDSKINFSDIVIGRDEWPADLDNKFDYFIAGSDQIWNPYYDFVAGKCDFLQFANKCKRISYAASFGINNIPVERQEEYRKNLEEFHVISVRERQGKKIVENLTNKSAEVVLDPTFLLNEEEWNKLVKRPKMCPKTKYVLVYALGEKNERFVNKIEMLKKDFVVFDVLSKNRFRREKSIGPSEFIYLIKNAEIILTDSFHATAFSIIFHKRFVTYNRMGLNMNSRIESIAEIAGIKSCLNQNGDLMCDSLYDYSNVEKKINNERKKSIDFLKKSLKI